MRRTADAIVIGAGILGTSIGLELARLGLRVVVVDRNGEVGEGSTRSSTAIIRSFYGTKPAIALAFEGRKVFECWSDHLGLERPGARLEPVGCALLLPSEQSQADAVAALMRSVGVPVETLSGREAQGLIPGMRGGKTRVLFEPGAGFVTNPTVATRDVRTAAEAAGARFVLGERVTEVRSCFPGRNGARHVTSVITASGLRIDAPVVVNAAGPHSAQVNFLARAPLPLLTAPLAQRIIRGKVEGTEGLPVIADLPSGHYVRFDRSRFKLGTLGPRDDCDWLADPDGRKRVPKSFLVERRHAFHRRHPDMRWHEAKVRTALYDVTVLDWYPILDRTDLGGYYVAIGTSGSWFKGGPTIGWLMAQLIAAVESGRDHDREPLRLTLPRSGLAFDLGFFSRNRRAIRSELGKGVLG
jgi:sarcosine oxidase subunit beta